MDIKEQVLNFVRIEGPVLPVQISKKLGSDTMYAGAILSDLVSKKLIKISNAKIGGSPVYYVLGQEQKLGKLYDYLPNKEKEAYNLLKEKKILKDTGCEPGIRVALRQIKDFAIPMLSDNEIIWKWHLISDEEANNIFQPKTEIKEVPVIVEKKEELITEPPKVIVEKKTKKIKSKSKTSKENLLLREVYSYLSSKKIELLETKDIKKNEINMVINFNSDLGKLRYFLYAKDKMKISDSDLRLAYSKSQQNKLPVLFLTNGKLSKKAQKYLDDMRGFIVFKGL